MIIVTCYCCFTDEWIERSYTPVLPLVGGCHGEGSEVKLMVKLYNKGAMSSILSSLHVGMNSVLSMVTPQSCTHFIVSNILFLFGWLAHN